ncbi:MAG: hypothetical protein HC769_16360 [Cyanobacteria bacterium CRU_2_1]|nr:hypothetical protein [Cyanobacteria bacterium CRU_2_1]
MVQINHSTSHALVCSLCQRCLFLIWRYSWKTKPDEETRKQLREVYGNDAMMLIAVGQTVATEFATFTKCL